MRAFIFILLLASLRFGIRGMSLPPSEVDFLQKLAASIDSSNPIVIDENYCSSSSSYPQNLFTISCTTWNNTRRISSLHLFGLSHGSMPLEVSILQNLTSVRITNSYIQENLQSDLLANLANVPSLTYLEAINQTLRGTISSALFELPNLAQLILPYNQIKGNFPANFGGSLISVQMGHNLISGTIPVVRSGASLYSLDFNSNYLSGDIPQDAFDAVPSLKKLNLVDNDLTGCWRPTQQLDWIIDNNAMNCPDQGYETQCGIFLSGTSDEILMKKLSQYALAAYEDQVVGGKVQTSLKRGYIKGSQVLAMQPSSLFRQSEWFLATDVCSDVPTLSLRGTNVSPKDVLTDLDDQPVRYHEGYVHRGMYQRAMSILPEITALRPLLQSYKVLHITGHSLGAGLAAIITHELQRDPSWKFLDIHAVGFATPRIISSVVNVQNFTSYIFRYDIVPAASVFTVGSFLEQCNSGQVADMPSLLGDKVIKDGECVLQRIQATYDTPYETQFFVPGINEYFYGYGRSGTVDQEFSALINLGYDWDYSLIDHQMMVYLAAADVIERVSLDPGFWTDFLFGAKTSCPPRLFCETQFRYLKRSSTQLSSSAQLLVHGQWASLLDSGRLQVMDLPVNAPLNISFLEPLQIVSMTSVQGGVMLLTSTNDLMLTSFSSQQAPTKITTVNSAGRMKSHSNGGTIIVDVNGGYEFYSLTGNITVGNLPSVPVDFDIVVLQSTPFVFSLQPTFITCHFGTTTVTVSNIGVTNAVRIKISPVILDNQIILYVLFKDRIAVYAITIHLSGSNLLLQVGSLGDVSLYQESPAVLLDVTQRAIFVLFADGRLLNYYDPVMPTVVQNFNSGIPSVEPSTNFPSNPISQAPYGPAPIPAPVANSAPTFVQAPVVASVPTPIPVPVANNAPTFVQAPTFEHNPSPVLVPVQVVPTATVSNARVLSLHVVAIVVAAVFA